MTPLIEGIALHGGTGARRLPRRSTLPHVQFLGSSLQPDNDRDYEERDSPLADVGPTNQGNRQT